jgi:hypothetical protein
LDIIVDVDEASVVPMEGSLDDGKDAVLDEGPFEEDRDGADVDGADVDGAADVRVDGADIDRTIGSSPMTDVIVKLDGSVRVGLTMS